MVLALPGLRPAFVLVQFPANGAGQGWRQAMLTQSSVEGMQERQF